MKPLAEDAGLPFNIFIEKLVETGLVYVKKGQIRFLTDQCMFAILRDDRFAAGENKNGNFSNWIKNYLNDDD
ncbi:hypothetical protein [Chitinophaga sancti]|uniref:Uncharacterized protein n=1 Tax=Chitinophaga sancti TaxID=1004 RepID=A0ABZ0XMD2_9BACT|nr:hypothetical protein [Chitinophaga sancti]WQG91792.1 hypothetical protein SR876_09770 [Chitinophaga sancti]